MRIITRGLPPITLALLAACGGSQTAVLGTYGSYDDVLGQGVDLAATILPVPYTAPSTLPTGGTATHKGVVAAQLGSTSIIVGEIILETDFANSEVSGVIGNLFGDDNTEYDGTLDVQNGVLDRNVNIATHYTYSADINGTLTDGGDTHVVSAFLDGDYTGTNYKYVEGAISGNVTTNGILETIDGEFYGER